MIFKHPSDETSVATSTSKKGFLNFFLIFFAVLQGSSQLLGLFLLTEDDHTPSLLKIWLSLGDQISENWLAVSVSLFILVFGYQIYTSLSFKPSLPGSNSKSIWLLFINIAICLRIYSSISISKKITYLASHLSTVVIMLIIVFFATAGIIIIKKERRNTEELNSLFQEVRDEKKEKVSSEDGTTDNVEANTNTPSDLEVAFRLKHPFSYAFRSFAKDLYLMNEIKRENKKKLLEIKCNTKRQINEIQLKKIQKTGNKPEDKGENAIGYFSAFLAFAICVCLIIFLVAQNSNGGNLKIIEIIKSITNFIRGIAGSLGDAEGPLTEFLLTSGVLFLFVILVLAFFLLVYTSIRVIAYLLSRPSEDTKRIHRIGKAIKTFVLGILDGALRPLMFIPDFLECLEEMLLDTNMDEKIEQMYPPTDSSPEASETTPTDVADEDGDDQARPNQ